MRCILCKSNKIRLFYQVHKWNIYKCDTCSFVFVYPYLKSAKLRQIYKSFDKNIFEKTKIIFKDAKHTIEMINKYKGNRQSLLDVGCGNGIFLDIATGKKWKVTGVDMSLTMINYLKKFRDYKVINGDILSMKISEKFDLITMNQVIEHFTKPRLLVKRCYKLLDKSGLLYIATPNIGSNVANIRKDEFDYLIPPEHLSYFNRQTLINLLTFEGFKIIKVSSWSYPVDLAGVIKYMCGIRKVGTLKKHDSNTTKIKFFKLVKYIIFDRIFCKLFYRILNINYRGTMIEVLAQKI